MSAPHGPIRLRRPVAARSKDDPHRAATPLELFFDLVFVIAIAQAAVGLHHAIAEDHVGQGVFRFLLVFFAIWWAWINFTWFASAYDNDDVVYRLLVFLQLTGALVLAAGVSTAFDENSWGIPIFGYVIMRLSMAIQWLRVFRWDTGHRAAALRYVIGIIAVQIAWCVLYFLPAVSLTPGFLFLILVELAVPLWAEAASATTWHPGHVAERYGLFTMIVLGESVLAATVAIQSTSFTSDFDGELFGIIVGGLLIIFSMWWLYFARNAEELLTSFRRAFIWGYGHYFVFGAAAAVGAGLAVSVDYASAHAEIGSFEAGAAVAFPVAMYLLGVWAIHYRFLAGFGLRHHLAPIVAVLILLTPLSDIAVLLTGLLLAGYVTVKVVLDNREALGLESGRDPVPAQALVDPLD